MSKLKREELLWNLDYWVSKKNVPYNILTQGQSAEQIKEQIQKPEVTEEWIEGRVRESINKSFKDYETEIQAILFVDPIHKSSYRKINKATDALVDHIWDSIRSLVEEINES